MASFGLLRILRVVPLRNMILCCSKAFVEFTEFGLVLSKGILNQLSILNEDQKSNWMGFEDSGTSSFHYQGQVDCLTTHLLH